jgi:hypothetical protein
MERGWGGVGVSLPVGTFCSLVNWWSGVGACCDCECGSIDGIETAAYEVLRDARSPTTPLQCLLRALPRAPNPQSRDAQSITTRNHDDL